MLEIGKTYSQKELAIAIGRNPSTFSRNKEKYLKNLSQYYRFTIIRKGKFTHYTIEEKLTNDEYKNPIKINAKDLESAQNFAYKVINKNPIQTAMNVARKASIENNPKQIKAKSLYTGYYCPGMREWYGDKPGSHGTIGAYIEDVWARLDKISGIYYEIPNELIEEYFSYVEDYREFAKDIITTVKNYEADKETSEEMWEKQEEEKEEKLNIELKKIATNLVQTANSRFYEKYGYIPIRAHRYENGIIFNE